eukprot:COSAG02_NODE_32440_length_516_cov_0.896882_1_plen_64_part_01
MILASVTVATAHQLPHATPRKYTRRVPEPTWATGRGLSRAGFPVWMGVCVWGVGGGGGEGGEQG